MTATAFFGNPLFSVPSVLVVRVLLSAAAVSPSFPEAPVSPGGLSPVDIQQYVKKVEKTSVKSEFFTAALASAPGPTLPPPPRRWQADKRRSLDPSVAS